MGRTALTPDERRARIASRAYELYQTRGASPGHHVEDWLEAERQINCEFSSCFWSSLVEAVSYRGRRSAIFLFKVVNCLVSCFALEFLVKVWPNGSTVIIIRSILISLVVYSLIVFVKFWFDPLRISENFFSQFAYDWTRNEVTFMPIVAGAYLALYTRFSQQWHYLAGVFNNIKTAQARTGGGRQPEGSKGIIDQMKAAFLEDADDLHLATKQMFAFAAYRWGNEDGVRRAYIQLTRNGEVRLTKLQKTLEKIYPDFPKLLQNLN